MFWKLPDCSGQVFGSFHELILSGSEAWHRDLMFRSGLKESCLGYTSIFTPDVSNENQGQDLCNSIGWPLTLILGWWCWRRWWDVRRDMSYQIWCWCWSDSSSDAGAELELNLEFDWNSKLEFKMSSSTTLRSPSKLSCFKSMFETSNFNLVI